MATKRVFYGQISNPAARASKLDCNTIDLLSQFEADKRSCKAHFEDPPHPSSQVLGLIGPECNINGLQSPSSHFEADKRSCKARIEDPSHPSSQVLGLIGPECNINGLQSPSNHYEADKRSCDAYIEDPPHPSSQVLGLIGPECNINGLQSPSSHFEADKRSCEAHIEDPPHPSSHVLGLIGPECNMSGLQSPSSHCEADKRSCKAQIEDSPNSNSQVLGLIGPECNMSGLQSPSSHFEADKRSCKAYIEDPPHPSSHVLGSIGLECNMSGLQSPSNHCEADKRSCKAHIEDSSHPSSQILEFIGPECNMSGLQSPSSHFEADKRSCKAHIEDPPHPSSQVLEFIGPECNMSGLQSPSSHFEADKRSCKAHIEDPPHPSSQVLEFIGPECNMSGLQSPSSHFEADKRSCKAHIEDPPHPSSQVLEPICPWRENRWQLLGHLVLLNKKKCEHFPRWFISAGECCHLIARASATREFCAAIERAKYLLEECSYDEWLLKAVELWECTEHFVEVLLDLCWSAYIMNLVVGSIERSEKWMSSVEELVKSRSEQNDVARLFHENCNENDKRDLEGMVEVKLADKTLKVDCAEHQLAHLLQDRLKNQSLWQPPFLKRHSFYIFKDFIVPLQRSSKTGAHGAILKFPWVYGKEFAMKLRHPKEDGQKSFKWEFEILDKYRSPYIVGVVGYWEAQSWASWNPFTPTFMCPFLLMESLECDLKDLMDRCKRYKSAQEGFGEGFSELETINLMLPIAKALRFLHGKDVAHRDLKSQNIMCKNINLQEDREGSIVREDSIVKLIDFGEARINVSNLADGEWGRAGTPGYMDPTMWKQDVVGYTLFMGDVFSFAMVFAELLTWRSPSEAFGVQLPRDAQTRLKADKRPPLPNGLPNYVRFIVESCWHVDHLKRPDFNAICLMLQHAKMLLLDKDFAYEPEDLFSYEDATGGECCISDQL